MRKIIIYLVAASAVAWASYAHAALTFNADFSQDSSYETSWPMKAGDVVTVDIYVSSVPAPGLISMGFKLTYDSSRLAVVEDSTSVDMSNWLEPPDPVFIDVEGDIDEIDMSGFRLTGLAGDNIRLGTVTFQCISEGTSAFMLLDRDADWFVLDNGEETVLDGDIGTGVLLANIVEFYDLTVTKSGDGTGTVASLPSGIDCGEDCAESYGAGTSVVLTATPGQDSQFVSWTGCDSVNNNTCTVNMTGDRTVSAAFSQGFPWEIFYPAFIKRAE